MEAGGDISCGEENALLETAFRSGLVSAAAVDRAVKRVLRSRVLVGDLNHHGHDPYETIGLDVVDSVAHRELAIQMSRESVVLLKRGSHFPLHGLQGKVLYTPPALDFSLQVQT